MTSIADVDRPARHQRERRHRDAHFPPDLRRRDRTGQRADHPLRRHRHTAGAATDNNGRRAAATPQQRSSQQFMQRQSDGRSDRALFQSRVVAVADPRTNSVLVSASHERWSRSRLTIGRLDATERRSSTSSSTRSATPTPTTSPRSCAACTARHQHRQQFQRPQQPSTSRLASARPTARPASSRHAQQRQPHDRR